MPVDDDEDDGGNAVLPLPWQWSSLPDCGGTTAAEGVEEEREEAWGGSSDGPC